MTEEDRNETAERVEIGADRADDVRKTKGIRFSVSEWEEVKRAALAHDISRRGVRPRDGSWRSPGPRRAPLRPRLRRLWRR